MRWLFVTATDTDAGKTTFARLWLERLCRLGMRPAALKPVASGVVAENPAEQRANGDALALQKAAGGWQSMNQVNPICFDAPVAPHIAAERVGEPLTLETVERRCADALNQLADVGLVEGAGGFLLPLQGGHTLADWVALHRLEVILVVPLQLGCLNHALLTSEAMGRRKLKLLGWVANIRDPNMPCLQENLRYLEEMLPGPRLAHMEPGPSGQAVLHPQQDLLTLEAALRNS